MDEIEKFPTKWGLREKINWIKDYDPNSLLLHNKSGKILSGVEVSFHRIQLFLERLDISKVEKLNQQQNLGIEGYLDYIPVLINQFAGSNKLASSRAQAVEEYEQKLNKTFLNIGNALSPYTALITASPSAKIQEYEEEAKQALSGILETGVAKTANYFDEESKKHSKNACIWMVFVIGVSSALLGCAVCFYCSNNPPTSDGLSWNYYLPRFSILGLLVFLQITLIGIYRAERHNAVVNKHRANALKTFEVMTEASSENITEAITLIAAGAIYAPQETGYSKRGVASTPNAADILASISKNKD